MKVNWTKNIPTKAGIYWFYGKGYRRLKINELSLVKVQSCGNGIIYIIGFHFINENQMEGWWAEVDLPELPKEEPECFYDEDSYGEF